LIAGNSPSPYLGAPSELFQLISGTSISSSHVAGVAALIRQAHPCWTPAQVKPAPMTTAHQDVMKEKGAAPADRFDMGAAHIVSNSAIDPGLVHAAHLLDYLALLRQTGSAVQSTCLQSGHRQAVRLSDDGAHADER
jgi:subtilisin family serine protease